MGNATAELIQEPLCRQTAIMQAGQVAPAGGQEYALVAVAFLYAVQLTCQGIKSLIPGNSFKFSLTTVTSSFLREHKSVRMMDILPERPAP